MSKQRMAEERAKKEEKKQLASRGMCIAPTSQVMTMKDYGQVFASKA